MSAIRGNIHEYIGMTLDIEEMLSEFDKAETKGGCTKSSTSPKNILIFNEHWKKLKHNKVMEFHNMATKHLYATKRARTDTCTVITFLTKKVCVSEKENWFKLVLLMWYIRGTCTLPLLLSANGSGILKWWVDASFAVHPNMRGSYGGGLSLGRGFTIVSSTKQNLNMKIFTAG